MCSWKKEMTKLCVFKWLSLNILAQRQCSAVKKRNNHQSAKEINRKKKKSKRKKPIKNFQAVEFFSWVSLWPDLQLQLLSLFKRLKGVQHTWHLYHISLWMNVLSSMLLKFPHLFTKPFSACKKQDVFTQAVPFKLHFFLPGLLARCWDLQCAKEWQLAGWPPALELHASPRCSSGAWFGPWACLLLLKSREEKPDILLEETQSGKGSITVTTVCSSAARSRSGFVLFAGCSCREEVKANQPQG